VIFLKNSGRDNEISITQLVGLKPIVISIHRPHSNAKAFLTILDEIMSNVLKKGHFMVVCGNWNINPLQENINQKSFIKFSVVE
jgi:hypothetical protein